MDKLPNDDEFQSKSEKNILQSLKDRGIEIGQLVTYSLANKNVTELKIRNVNLWDEPSFASETIVDQFEHAIVAEIFFDSTPTAITHTTAWLRIMYTSVQDGGVKCLWLPAAGVVALF